MKARATRRGFLRGAIALAAAAVASRLPIGGSDFASAQVPPHEVYEGFLLLDVDESVPADAGRTNRRAPEGESLDGRAIPQADIQTRSSTSETAKAAGIAMFMLPLSKNLREAEGVVTYELTGRLFSVSTQVEQFVASRDRWEPFVTVVAEPYQVRPVPARSGGGPGDKDVPLLKAPFLPNPGIAMEAGEGYVGQWLDDDVRYTLMCHQTDGFRGFRKIVADLESVS
jgi:hypothetical protein